MAETLQGVVPCAGYETSAGLDRGDPAPGLGGSRTWMISDSVVQGVAFFTLQTCISHVLAGCRNFIPSAFLGKNERRKGSLWE